MTSSAARQRRSPWAAARSSSRLGSRRVAATRSPRVRSCSVSFRPNPRDAPVMSQVFMSSMARRDGPRMNDRPRAAVTGSGCGTAPARVRRGGRRGAPLRPGGGPGARASAIGQRAGAAAGARTGWPAVRPDEPAGGPYGGRGGVPARGPRGRRGRRRAREVGRDAVRGDRELRVGYAEDLGTALFEAAGARVVPVPMSTPEQLRAVRDRRLDAAWCWEPEVPATSIPRSLGASVPWWCSPRAIRPSPSASTRWRSRADRWPWCPGR